MHPPSLILSHCLCDSSHLDLVLYSDELREDGNWTAWHDIVTVHFMLHATDIVRGQLIGGRGNVCLNKLHNKITRHDSTRFSKASQYPS